jgi:diguanylate cyclase (GGDEF)-like protein
VTLRKRLSLAFVLVVFVPVAIGAILVGRGIPSAMRTQTANELHAASASAGAALTRLCGTAQLAAEVLARTSASSSPQAATRDIVARGRVDYAAVRAPSGAVRASAGTIPGSRSRASAASGQHSCAAGAPQGTALAATVTVRADSGADLGTATAAIRYSGITQQLSRNSGVDITLVGSDGTVQASTLPRAEALRVGGVIEQAQQASGPLSVDGMLVAAVPAGSGAVAVATAPRPSATSLVTIMVAVVGGGLVLSLLLGWLLARITTRPLAELADAAKRVAGGDLDARIAVRSTDEVGQLGAVFNEMTDELGRTIRELTESRDQLRTSLSRLGDTLSSTLDLKRTLSVIVDTATASVRAQAGALLLHAQTRADLYLATGRGLDARGVPRSLRIPMGEGIIGRVAVSGEPVVGRVSRLGRLTEPGLRASESEPEADNVIAVPLRSGDRTLGVLILYDRRDGAFDEDDLNVVRSFAGHAAVAIDNVLRAQDAQRASITDGLTGLWNFRYFQMALAKEVERATRFGRPLTLMMLDLDHFKRVNDEHGHLRGDAVLVELARRLRDQVREVDLIARYGGEEMIVILPETDLGGAQVVAERVCAAVRGTPFGDAGEEPLAITVSAGLAAFPEHGATVGVLVRNADEALYAAKREGRDRWRTARPATGGIAARPSLPAGEVRTG